MTVASPTFGEKLLAWRQILRLGNVFTAVSNVLTGHILVTGRVPRLNAIAWGVYALLAASALLYLAGMVLNDAFDAEVDARERPERPIPSGRIDRSTAFRVGWTLLSAGVAIAFVVSAAAADVAPGVVAACLAVAIVVYDAGLKSTSAGPWSMGWCRTLNALLAASHSAHFPGRFDAWAYAIGVGLYTVCLTYLARGEATGSAAQDAARRTLIKALLQGFIVIDAVIATVAAGWPAGAIVLSLLIPTWFLSRRAPMT
jgi:4-hydroxybenzoate polyprenyltransferase